MTFQVLLAAMVSVMIVLSLVFLYRVCRTERFVDGDTEHELVYLKMNGCPHCVAFDRVWDEIDKGLRTRVQGVSTRRLLYTEPEVASKYEPLDVGGAATTRFPSVFMYIRRSGAARLEVYNGPRTAAAVQAFVMQQLGRSESFIVG